MEHVTDENVKLYYKAYNDNSTSPAPHFPSSVLVPKGNYFQRFKVIMCFA